MSIRREIEVTRKALPRPIDVTYGTNILPIELEIIDFELPAGATATASCESVSKKSRTQSCSISGNVISFTPKAGFFEEGKNILQLNISANGGVLHTFIQPVNCHYTIGISSEYEGDDNPGTSSENQAVITIDSALSKTSTNPVQNKVVAKKFEEIESVLANVPDGDGETVSGVTAAQANSLWAILQKTDFVEVATETELNNFKAAWGIVEDGDTGEEGEDNTGEETTTYTWEKYEAVESVLYTIVYDTGVEITDNQVTTRVLYKTISIDSTGKIVLSDALKESGSYGSEIVANYQSYPFIYIDGEVYKITSYASKGTYQGFGGTTERAVVETTASGVYTKGEYIGEVTSTIENTYPENGYQYGYWYVKK